MTKSFSKKTVVVAFIAIALAVLAILSPVLLNSRSQKQGKENMAAVSKSSETDGQANSTSAIDENAAEENSGSQAATAESNPNTADTAPSNAQNQSAPDNDIPADGSSPSASTENSSNSSSTSGTNAPTATPDNDIKAE